MVAEWSRVNASDWQMPASVVVAELDRATRDLSEPDTPAERRYLEYFIAGTEPAALRVDARRLFLGFGPIPVF